MQTEQSDLWIIISDKSKPKIGDIMGILYAKNVTCTPKPSWLGVILQLRGEKAVIEQITSELTTKKLELEVYNIVYPYEPGKPGLEKIEFS